MKYHYFLVLLLFINSCKTPEPATKQVLQVNTTPGCILGCLPRTTDYANQIEHYRSIYKDTIIEIESVQIGPHHYKSLLDLKKSERYIYLVSTKESAPDSLLIHCLTPLKSVDATFNREHCEIELETSEFDKNGTPIFTNYQTVHLAGNRP